VLNGQVGGVGIRLGSEPLKETFSQVARPVATGDTAGAFFGPWRVVSIDGLTFGAEAPAGALGGLYQWRWEHETGNQQLKTYLRGPGKILRSRLPDLVLQEVWGYRLTHYALAALICTAATAAGVDPNRVRFLRTVRIVRKRVGDPSSSP
jgi:hypothetical protein